MLEQKERKFGTAPVFFTAISTILGAILFLRFGFAVGQVGFLGTLLIILIGHAVTIPTAMAIGEIATNQKVEGGGEYYIISRSFGLVIGSTIGIALFLSQAVSVAFYVMAFSEAFTPLIAWLSENFQLPDWLEHMLQLKQTVGIPALLFLTFIMLTKGADLGLKALYLVVATLGIALAVLFLGQTDYGKTQPFDPLATVNDFKEEREEDLSQTYEVDSVLKEGDTIPAPIPEVTLKENKEIPVSPLVVFSFFTVFAIIFPAFTGMTAGVGLSGDLKDPGRSIPLGTMAATVIGMVMYIAIAYKLALSAPPELLADTSRLVMSDIAWQGWIIIPIGLAAATISSALGSIMVAPRTLQAIARDKIFPAPNLNSWLSLGKGKNDEPFNASLITIAIAAGFILLGAIDSVAKIISIFFMVTYGSLCLISFLNHFAADPSYRPKFRSKWYISLFGALGCFVLMFLMNALYAFLAILIMAGLFFVISYFNRDKRSVAAIFQGALFQINRKVHVFLQKAEKEKIRGWRPSIVALSEASFDRIGLFDLVSWISSRSGFGTYIHVIKGYLSKDTHVEATHSKERLIRMAEDKKSNVIVDTIVSPSYTSTIAQVIQLPGITGTENNFIVLEYSRTHPEFLKEIMDNLKLIKAVNFNVGILVSSPRGFGLRKHIHIWITNSDYDNATLMILLSYILLGDREWKGAEVRIFVVFKEKSIKEDQKELERVIRSGKLPISLQNVEIIPHKEDVLVRDIITQHSENADLSMIGFREDAVKHLGKTVFTKHALSGNVLFVSAAEEVNAGVEKTD